MDEESTGRRRTRRNREEVGLLLADFAGSGLSQKQWCELNTVSVATLGYWLRREREESSGEVSLVPIEVRNDERATATQASDKGMRPGPVTAEAEAKARVGPEPAGVVAAVVPVDREGAACGRSAAPMDRKRGPGPVQVEACLPALVLECGGCRLAFVQVGDVALAARLLRALGGEGRR